MKYIFNFEAKERNHLIVYWLIPDLYIVAVLPVVVPGHQMHRFNFVQVFSVGQSQ